MSLGKTDIWMPIYIGDYLADTMHLTTEQHGAYLLLLFHLWRRGKLPADDLSLTQICGLSSTAWGDARAVLAEFFEIRDGFWRHGRVGRERERIALRQESSVRKAKSAALSRWHKQTPHNRPLSPEEPSISDACFDLHANNAAGNAHAMPQPSQSESETETTLFSDARFNTASAQNAANFGNAQNAFGSAQSDIGDYQKQLAQFVSGNPYTKGGEFDQTINQGLTNVSDAGSNSLKGALQSQALRTGQNSAANAATAASAAQQNTRDLAGDLASAQQQRIAGEAGYNQDALQASAVPADLESSLYGTSGNQGNQELGAEEGAAQTPSFWDEVGNGFAGGLGKALGGRA